MKYHVSHNCYALQHVNSLVYQFPTLDYSGVIEGTVFEFCLSLLKEKQLLHRVISLFEITLITLLSPQLLILHLWFSHIIVISLMGIWLRSNHLWHWVGQAGPTSALLKGFGLEVENVKWQKLRCPKSYTSGPTSGHKLWFISHRKILTRFQFPREMCLVCLSKFQGRKPSICLAFGERNYDLEWR